MRAMAETERLRAQIRALGHRGPGRRDPASVRDAVLSYVAGRRAQGVSLRNAALELGVPWRTVRHWREGASPAVGAGSAADVEALHESLYGVSLAIDFDGAARPQGGAPDIGAFEQ